MNFSAAFSQNLTGTWEGSAGGAPYWKLSIVQIGDSCYGYNYDEGVGYCKANIAGHFNRTSQKFKGAGLNFIEKTFFHALATYNLKYSRNGTGEYLKGTVSAKTLGAKLYSLGLPFPAQLHKTSDRIDTTAFMALKIEQNAREKDAAPLVKLPATDVQKQTGQDGLNLPNDSIITKKENRNSKLVKTIYTTEDSIKMVLYDDGVVDGDIVTVFYNNKIVVNKLPLTSNPFELVLQFNSADSSHVIELVAENLGSIPPNTAYLLIIAGNDRYEVKASYDLLSNAKIIIENKK